jgi:hypothetical protein
MFKKRNSVNNTSISETRLKLADFKINWFN